MSRIIGLVSGKGGVGKTTTAVNLASALVEHGLSAVVIDGNLDTPNVGVFLGNPVVDVSIHRVLQGKDSFLNATESHISGLDFVAGGLAGNAMRGVKHSRLKKIKELDHDFVLVDGPAGLGADVQEIVKCLDEFVIVTNSEMPAITDALKTVKYLEGKKKKIVGIVVTRVKKDNLDVSLNSIEEMLEHPVIGMIPEDDHVRESVFLKDTAVSAFPSSAVTKGYLRLGAGFAGVEYTEEMSILDKILGWFKWNGLRIRFWRG